MFGDAYEDIGHFDAGARVVGARRVYNHDAQPSWP